ncbi:lysine-rich nucleolar protein 1 [Rhineura floridana]|uniref:lysine-rich nucleolar protein 1 n=1 Tax=Rhineura floridana TaxID=261503 RepID=UPI002AC886B2|nr:lysine-rich nucleolar protein 1 [Rhineura floridana]
MVIKDASNSSERGVQTKNKVKAILGNQTVIIGEDDGSSDLQTKIKVNKNKLLVKGEGSDQIGSKKKVDSKLKTKGCASCPIVIESSSDSELVKEIERMPKMFKKKGKRVFSCERGSNQEVSSKELANEQQEACFLISKKHKRNIPNSGGEDDDESPAKMKKKKRKHKSVHSLILHSGSNKAESLKRISKKSKTISQETTIHNRKKIQTLVQYAAGDSNIVKKKKGCCLTEKGIANPVSQLEELSCKGTASGLQQHLEDTACTLEEGSKANKKWKKKKEREKQLLTSADNNYGVSTENQLKRKSKKKASDGKDEKGMTPDSKGNSKLTKKKKTQTKVVGSRLALLEDSGDVSTKESRSSTKRTKRKKKTPKSKEVGDHIVSHEEGGSENSSKQHVKKRRKEARRENRDFQACGEEPSWKKAKIKEEAKEGDDEIEEVAFKEGNCDKKNIDKLRRQALQEEIDRESGKTKAIKQKGDWDAHFGQWSTAMFESSEQKTKFLRLLGGFKKDSAPAQGSPAQVSKLNMALDRSKEQKLQQKLQTEFEKAVALKHHGGIGLGFQPAVQKHVHIDKFASKSIKFED